jgi:hypothetical protein
MAHWNKRWGVAIAAAFCLLIATREASRADGPATPGADTPAPPDPASGETLEQARQELERKLALARTRMQAAKENGEQGLKDAQQAIQSAGQKLKSAADQVGRVGDRAARADDARRLAFQRLEPHVKRPSEIPAAARLEFRVHARRMARLARIRALAEYANDRPIIERTDRVSERERTRHQHALTRVWPALSDPKAVTRGPDESEPRVLEDEEEQEPEP